MSVKALKPTSTIESLHPLYADNPVMQVLGESRYMTLLSEDENKVKEWNAITAAVNHEIERKGRIRVTSVMMVAYSLGVIHGKQMERQRKKRG